MRRITEQELTKLLDRIKAEELCKQDSYGSALARVIGHLTAHAGDDANSRMYTEADLEKIFQAAEREYYGR